MVMWDVQCMFTYNGMKVVVVKLKLTDEPVTSRSRVRLQPLNVGCEHASLFNLHKHTTPLELSNYVVVVVTPIGGTEACFHSIYRISCLTGETLLVISQSSEI